MLLKALGISVVSLLVVRAHSVLAEATPLPSAAESSKHYNSVAKNPHVCEVAPLIGPYVPDLGKAAYKGDLTVVRRLISSGTRVDVAGQDGRTPLILAAAGGHLEILDALLAAGANINARDTTGATALHWAAMRGEDKVAFMLLSHRPNVNVQALSGDTPLMLAAIAGDEVIVRALLASGARADLKDADGFTATDFAKKNKYDTIVSILRRTSE
jgi:ankyrin repeat protein